MTAPDDDDVMLSTAEAARFLGREREWLEKLRHTPHGPKYVRLGTGRNAKCTYTKGELRRFRDKHTFSSTAEELAASTVKK